MAIAGMVLLAGTVCAGTNSYASTIQASYADIGPETSIPYGWVDFCSRRPEECDVPRLPPLNVKVTTKTWQLLDRVNREVNAYIQPVSNLEHWGTILDH